MVQSSAPGFAMVVGAMVTFVGVACINQSPTGAPPQATPAAAAPTSTSGTVPATSPSTDAAAARSSSPSAAPSVQPALAAPSASPAASPGAWNFDTDATGSVPAGAQVFSGQWAVRPESDTPSPPNALCQTGQADFPSIGLDSRPIADLTMVAKFKPISGREDQAGGLIFRVQDKDNYYIVRANALEDNVIFFIYQNARRSQLKGAGAKVESGKWHELRVDVRGNAFAAFVDGKPVVDVTDDRYKMGGVGLWTKADSVTCFDDVKVTGA